MYLHLHVWSSRQSTIIVSVNLVVTNIIMSVYWSVHTYNFDPEKEPLHSLKWPGILTQLLGRYTMRWGKQLLMLTIAIEPKRYRSPVYLQESKYDKWYDIKYCNLEHSIGYSISMPWNHCHKAKWSMEASWNAQAWNKPCLIPHPHNQLRFGRPELGHGRVL